MTSWDSKENLVLYQVDTVRLISWLFLSSFFFPWGGGGGVGVYDWKWSVKFLIDCIWELRRNIFIFMSIIGGLRERTIPWFFGHFWKCPHAKIQLLLNTFKNGRKIKGSFLLWALQFYAGIHSIGYNLFFLSCGLIAVPEKPKTWAALAASRTPPAQSSSAPSTNSRPVRQAQQVAWKW